METIKLCFIISCKVYENYKSYLTFYVKNIKAFYPNAFIILVDNNSTYKEYFNFFKNTDGITMLENTSECKFELGAYKFATKYIIDNKLTFDYYICVQDTFVLVNKFDFNTLIKDNISACPIATFSHFRSGDIGNDVLQKLNIFDPNETFLCCWASSWICNHDNLIKIYELLANIIIIDRKGSTENERYMGKILKMLNSNKEYSIEGNETNRYDCHLIDPRCEEAKHYNNYFIKSAQQKNENTV